MQQDCVTARNDPLQLEAVAYLNAHHTEVSTSELTDNCMVSATNPWDGTIHKPHSSQNAAVGAPVARPGQRVRVRNPLDVYKRCYLGQRLSILGNELISVCHVLGSAAFLAVLHS